MSFSGNIELIIFLLEVNEAKFKFDDIIGVFELPKFENEIIEIFKTTLITYKSESDLNDMYKSFDKLILLNKE